MIFNLSYPRHFFIPLIGENNREGKEPTITDRFVQGAPLSDLFLAASQILQWCHDI